MKNGRRFLFATIILTAIALGSITLLSPSAVAVDNPCDPTYGLLRWCKSQHGRWDNTCCCCQLH